MKQPITFLHLSDIHLCSPKTGWDADRILGLLCKDLKKMEQGQELLPDFLVVTGDLAFGHLGAKSLSIDAQYEETYLFLEEVRNQFTRPISADRIFLVPGNHDVKRLEILDSQTAYLDALAAGDYEQSQKKINEMLRDASGEWPVILKRLEPYREFVSRCFPHLLTDPERLAYALQLEVRGIRIGIAGLNSAWSCGRDQEKGRLRSVALALVIPVGGSCRRQDSRHGDNFFLPRFVPLRAAAPPRARPKRTRAAHQPYDE